MKQLFEHEKIRFGVAGLANTGLDFVLLNTFVFIFGAFPILANAISVSIGISISYFLNHFFVFKSKIPVSFKKYVQFFCITGFSSLALQTLVIVLFTQLFESSFSRSLFILSGISGNTFLELNIAKIAAVLIGMIWNFMLYKYVIFRDKEEQADQSVIKQG